MPVGGYDMLRSMRKLVAALSILAAAAAAAAPKNEWTLIAEEWLRPQSGERVLGFDALTAAVRALDERPGATIVIRYPGGDEGLVWATQLEDWLVGLGVPSAIIQTTPGNGRTDALSVTVDGGRVQP